MTTNTLIMTAFLAMVAAVPTFALEGRVAGKQSNATSRPTTAAPPTSPINTPKSPAIPLAEPYAILNTMSIFAVDHRSAESRTKGVEQSSLVRYTPPSTPVFRGVMIDDNGPLALMEIPDSSGGMRNEYLREGQTVSWGDSKVLSITLDNLRLSLTPAFAWQHSWIDIPIGCNLNGQQIGTLPVIPGRGTGSSPNRRSPRPNWFSELGLAGNVGGNGSAGLANDPALPPGSTDNLEVRMIQRRQTQVRAVSKPESTYTATPVPD
jgi:hypothetical protein